MAEFKKLINPPIKASEINSESATDGQVLTANGTGGATWQDPSGGSGGGTSLFKHIFKIIYNDYMGYYKTINKESNKMSITSIASEEGQLDIIMKKHITSGEPGPMEPVEVHTAFLQITAGSRCFFTSALTESTTGFWDTSLTVTDTVTPL